jgi:hypothetical protein
MWWQKWMKRQSVVGVQVTADTTDINKTDINIMLTFSFIIYDPLHTSIDCDVLPDVCVVCMGAIVLAPSLFWSIAIVEAFL